MGSIYDYGQPANEGKMDKQAQNLSSEKMDARPGSPLSAARSSRWDNQGDVPAPPPVWTRYIESRLRQFGQER
jgi:hypothetical protein